MSEEKTNENIHQNHRQRVRDKFNKTGFVGFSEHEILELLLFYAIPQADTNPTAHRLINTFGSLANVFEASKESLMAVKGVGEQSATLIKLVPAIMQMCNKTGLMRQVLNNQKIAINYMKGLYMGANNELFYVICMDAKNNVLDIREMSSGSPNKVDVKIRSITEYCLRQNCSRIIISHNHPQSDAKPSNEDVIMTHKIFNSCVLNDIDVIDHIIVSPTDSYSFAETGIMTTIKQEVLTILKYSISQTKFDQFSTSSDEYVIK